MTVVRIAVRRDTTVNWTTADPILVSGEPALDLTTGGLRFGDGVSHWSELPEALDGGGADGSPGFAIGTVAPVVSGEYLWVQTDGNGGFVDLIVGKN